jgi:1L-myo-inositol 1-phosphate cytidylyltransferase
MAAISSGPNMNGGLETDMKRITTGIILAAGCGARMAETECSLPSKLLIPVRQKPLVWHAIRGLELAGCRRILVILGHAAEEVRSSILNVYAGRSKIEFLFNPLYRLSNGVSVLCAKDHLAENFQLVMGDHLVGDDIMTALPMCPPPTGGATLLVDRRLDKVFDLNDATKVFEKGGRICRIGKTVADFNCVDIGVFSSTPGLFTALDVVLVEKGDASLTDGIQRLADAGLMRAAPVDGCWQDIDTPEMLAHAESNFSSFRLAN